MKLLPLFALILLIPAVLPAQEVIPTAERQFRALSGDVYLLPFFIDKPEETWTDREVQECLAEMEKSQEWLLSESGRYSVKLNFIDDFIDTKKEEILIHEGHRIVQSWELLTKTVEYLGFDDYREYFEFHGLDPEKNKVCVLFFVKGTGRSHAYDFNRSYFRRGRSVDSAILYYQKASQRTNFLNQVVSHELLHLFGAWDLYDEQLSEKNARKAKMLFSDSVMRCSRCPEPKVDELTAFLVGWHQEYREEFMEFDPGKQTKEGSTRWTFDLEKKKKEGN